MKQTVTKHAIFQSFLFNVIILVIFIGIGSYYLYPKFIQVEEMKESFSELFLQNKKLQQKGISFKEFKNLYKISDWHNELIDNILLDFTEDDYNDNFSNTWGVYDTFLEAKILNIKEQRIQQEKTDIKTRIQEILPEYTSDSFLSNNSLTDFKFVNNLEKLLDRFQLSTNDKIWIWNLSELWKHQNKKWEKQIKQNPLDATIYKWKLQLNLIWEKINIINFIHYIENVWKITVKNKQVSVVTPTVDTVIVDNEGKRKKNNFLDITRYFKKGVNPYNGLLMEIENLEFSDYLDSSDLPTPDGYDLIQLAKDEQWNEKFQIDITLAYYVKGLPTFKIEKFISSVQKRHAELLKISQSWIVYVSKNRSQLKSSDAIVAISSLNNINRYLKGIKEDLNSIKKALAKKENLWVLYKSAQEFDTIFQTITVKLSKDLHSVSDTLYKKNKPILDKTNN